MPFRTFVRSVVAAQTVARVEVDDMPLTRFICPDNVEIPIGECLKSCRLGTRCLTLPTLILIAATERPWDGKPSTTRLLNGTMLEYLRITTEYASSPKSRAFALLGSNHHDRLARITGEWESEKSVGNGVPGTLDILEQDEAKPGHHILTDYKTFGSFRVAKVLGLVKETKPHPTEVYARSGTWGKAGTPKRMVTFKVDPQAVEMPDEILQLNHYRVLAEEQGYPISRMQLQITVRDGGLQVATERGVTESMYLVPVPRLRDETVKNYFSAKREALLWAISHKTPPQPCNERENWNTRRCRDYCEMAKACPLGQQVLATVGA